MEPLDASEWDVVLAGTGTDVSLLALALSRSGKKILHVDQNGYYGGSAAALSLQDANAWFRVVNGDSLKGFVKASIERPEIPALQHAGARPISQTLGFSRAYSLALAPDIIYARSTLLSALVSAKVDSQLEFLALGSWWLCKYDDKDNSVAKVPSAREDLFSDRSVAPKSKRALIKFLRFMGSYEEDEDSWRQSRDVPFATFLQARFGLEPVVQQPIHALVMSPLPAADTTTQFALKRVARHLRSIGVFGQGFGAVVSKWGGLAEITQVGCRGCAVGGGTYVLGQYIDSQELAPLEENSAEINSKPTQLRLSDGDSVRTKWVAYGAGDTPSMLDNTTQPSAPMSRSISIVSSSLESLFPPPAGGVPSPAGAVVCVSLPDQQPSDAPITVVVHSSDTGECPSGQCILYASTALPAERGHTLLKSAVALLLSRTDPSADVLWRLQYEQHCSPAFPAAAKISIRDHTILFPPPTLDTVFDDMVLDRVRSAWRAIMDNDVSDADFLNFSPRGEEGEDEGMDARDDEPPE